MADFQEDISGIFKPEELQAVEFAHNYFGGVAKQAAIDLGGALGLEPDAHLALVAAVAYGVDALDRPEERRGVYEHLNALTELLGRAPSRQTLQVVPVDTETAKPVGLYKTPKVPSLDLPSPTADDLIDNPVEEKRLGAPNKTFLSKLFKDIEGCDPEDISYAEAQVLAQKLSDVYVRLSILRLSQEAKEHRAAQLRDFFAGMDYTMIASKYGQKQGAIWQGISKMTETLRKQLEADQLKDILADSRKAAAISEGIPVPPADPTPTPEQGSYVLEIPDSIERALADVAALLGYTDKTRYELLKQIFDQSITNSVKNPEINEIRDDLKLVTTFTQKYKALPSHLRLSSLEERALLAVCGDDVALTPPLSVNSTQRKYSKELQQEKLRIDQVLRAALAKVVFVRQLMLEAGEKLV